MTDGVPGTGTPASVRTADLSRAWFVFAYWHPKESRDPRTCFVRGTQWAYQLALGEVRDLEAALRAHIQILQELQAEAGPAVLDPEVPGHGHLDSPEYRRGFRNALAASATWSGMGATEQHLLELLETWRIDFDSLIAGLEESSQPDHPEEVRS